MYLCNTAVHKYFNARQKNIVDFHHQRKLRPVTDGAAENPPKTAHGNPRVLHD